MGSVYAGQYLEGLLVGIAAASAFGFLCLIVYLRERKRDAKAPVAAVPPPLPGRSPVETAATENSSPVTEAAIYVGAGLVLILVLYVWITPVLPYAGIVEDKYTRSSCRKWNRTSCYIVVDGKKRPVSGDIYKRITTGDTVAHPLVQQRYDINGTAYVARDYAWNTGFWTGVIVSACAVLCMGALRRANRRQPPKSRGEGSDPGPTHSPSRTSRSTPASTPAPSPPSRHH